MAFEVLRPVSEQLLLEREQLHAQSLGSIIKVHSETTGIPDLNDIGIALIFVEENRSNVKSDSDSVDFSKIRKSFYQLFPGNWDTVIADLGTIKIGASPSDSYFVVRELVATLVKAGVIPVIIGGGQDLTYAMYRGYDKLDQMVNLVNIDSCFDLGNADGALLNTSFVGKMIVDEPYNLFNYSSIGYQTYFAAQDEIDLMQKLHFDTYRLGNVCADLSSVEPVLRNADIVTVDMSSIKSSELNVQYDDRPNGFDGKEICTIMRYAGLSDKVSSFGIFEYKNGQSENLSAMMVSQMLWYFIEGVNYRVNEGLDVEKGDFLSYNVPVDDDVLKFYKSRRTERWWIEIPFLSTGNNKLKRHTLLPCAYSDYLDACNQEIPERWWQARIKNEM